MRARWMVYSLLLILSVQLLPVKEWGKILYNNSLQEEICENMNCSEQSKDSNDDTVSFFNTINFHVIHKDKSDALNLKLYPVMTELPTSFSGEIPTPPPLFSA